MVLAGEEPGERARGELVPALTEEIRRGPGHDEGDLELGMSMGAGPSLAGHVSHDPSVDTRPKPKILLHRKKR